MTFNGGTNQFNTSAGAVTTIDGGTIKTGAIESATFGTVVSGGTGGGGTRLQLVTSSLSAGDSVLEIRDQEGAPKFKITKAGNITADSFAFNSGSIANGVTIGGTTAQNVATNTSAKTGGSVAGWTISSTTIVGADGNSNITLDSQNKKITIADNGTVRVKLGNLS